MGIAVNVVAYETLTPLVVALVSLIIASALLRLCSAVNEYERRTFVLVFAVCWFWAGVAALYASYSGDMFSDASYFFDTVTKGEGASQDIFETLQFTENGGAIVVWRMAYDFFHVLGVESSPCIGITLNTCFVALTSIVGIKMVRAVFGNDNLRIRRFTLVFVCCGMFWLYASLHIRDAAVLFSTSLLALFWLYFLAQPGIRSGAKLAAATIVALCFFGLLRREFVFVPIAMLCAGSAALALGSRCSVRSMAALTAIIILAVAANYKLSETLSTGVQESLTVNNEGYSDLTATETGAGSLGESLIFNQPIYVRLPLGAVYLLVFPIPFWSGFQELSAYHMFKSLHVLFMYMVIPLGTLAVSRTVLVSHFRTPQILFLIFVPVGFLFSIAYTSVETRHLGAFLVPFLVLSVLPDMSRNVDRRAYRLLCYAFLAAMAALHVTWMILKGI